MPTTPANILIVDDTEATRLKFALAVKALGHVAVAVEDGELALREVEHGNYDLILLDIVMPGLSGFDVLERLQANPATAAIPVLIVSSLHDDMSQVIHGISLGAVDFLPKQVDPAILRARISVAVAEKRRHDSEQRYLQHVGQLGDAAAVLEHDHIDPAHLQLADVCERDDSLGQFANYFTKLSQDIFTRERRLRRHIETLKGLLLLFACGFVSGLGIPLARIGSLESNHPFGLTAW